MGFIFIPPVATRRSAKVDSNSQNIRMAVEHGPRLKHEQELIMKATQEIFGPEIQTKRKSLWRTLLGR